MGRVLRACYTKIYFPGAQHVEDPVVLDHGIPHFNPNVWIALLKSRKEWRHEPGGYRRYTSQRHRPALRRSRIQHTGDGLVQLVEQTLNRRKELAPGRRYGDAA